MTFRLLHDIRVLDLGRFVAGPYCAMLLGDLGADVLKVEHPVLGDGSRRFGAGTRGPDNAYELVNNRNKRSLTLDLQQPRGRSIAQAIIQQSDVLIHNFRLGTMTKLGLDYATVQTLNPRLVYCEITGYGEVGPDSGRSALDHAIQAETGLMSVMGEPGGPPVKVPFPIFDLTAAMWACSAITAALVQRRSTGLGARISTSLFEAAMSSMPLVGEYLVSGELPVPTGHANASIAPSEAHRTADGWLMLSVSTDPQWMRFCQMLGLEDLRADDRYASNTARLIHRRELTARLDQLFATDSTATWVDKLGHAQIPCAPVATLDQVFENPQVQALDLVEEIPHPARGRFKMVRSPISVGGVSLPIRRSPPTFGQHTAEVLEGLGLTPEDIADLRSAKVV